MEEVMTRRCCYCTPKHNIGPDDGSGVYSDGMCRWAAFKEDVKWYAPQILRSAERLILPLALGYFAAQLARWSMEGFRIIG